MHRRSRCRLADCSTIIACPFRFVNRFFENILKFLKKFFRALCDNVSGQGDAERLRSVNGLPIANEMLPTFFYNREIRDPIREDRNEGCFRPDQIGWGRVE